MDRSYRGCGVIREVARAGDVQASAFDLAHEVLQESLRQPSVGVEEEDQISLRAIASYIPATRDGWLAVEDRGERVLGDADGRVAGAGVDILHRLDAAFFRVGEARDGLLVKFYAGEKHSEEELLSDFEENGLEAWRLKREGRLLMRPEEEP